jgi:4,5-DOPA dioxygenase extradiol
MNRKQFLNALLTLPLIPSFMNFNELSTIASTFSSTEKMPVLFVGHGSPMNAIEENDFVKEWRQVAQKIPKPNAILCISAHWETKGTFLTAMEKPKTIHDFGGFPKALFEVEYPAKGSPALAKETQLLLTETNATLDYDWGLDHGAWSVIKQFYPKADIPVIQMSIDYTKPMTFHYELAKQLSVLRKKGILILGSGNMVHNLGLVAWDKMNEPNFGFDWAIDANESFKKMIVENKHQALINYKTLGKEFQLSIPTPEHYIPLLYTLGLQEKNEKICFFNDQTVMGSLSMTSVMIG